MSTLERVRENRDEVLAIANCYGATNIRIFGSVARGDEDDRSDIDLLIDLAPGSSRFDLGGLLMELNRNSPFTPLRRTGSFSEAFGRGGLMWETKIT